MAERGVVVDEHPAFALPVPHLRTRAAPGLRDRADGELVPREAGTVAATFCVARSGAWDAVAARELHGDMRLVRVSVSESTDIPTPARPKRLSPTGAEMPDRRRSATDDLYDALDKMNKRGLCARRRHMAVTGGPRRKRPRGRGGLRSRERARVSHLGRGCRRRPGCGPSPGGRTPGGRVPRRAGGTRAGPPRQRPSFRLIASPVSRMNCRSGSLVTTAAGASCRPACRSGLRAGRSCR